MLISTPRSFVGSGSFLHIASAAMRIMLKLPMRLMLMTLANEASGCGPSLPTVFAPMAMPAQLIKPINFPIDNASATAACASASCVTSHLTKAPPISLASACPFATCTSATTTLPPSLASMRAVPSPRPEAPPVTSEAVPATPRRQETLKCTTESDRGHES